jgi:hypothetical protein
MKGGFIMAETTEGQFCSIKPTSPLPENPVVAMAYVPFQQFGTTFPPEKALSTGTLFPDLNKPFYGRRGAPK